MGSKGSTTTTSQNQTYQPAGANYVQAALQQAQGAASQPFNIPQAPVAGFSQDQQNAFGSVRDAQGMALPYINQAQGLFNQSAQGPNVSQFFNPYASAVTDQMKNIFGQQQSQTTGQLTQAAGGVGADRIAVGQANLANQQDLAAGQTLANLYAPSLSAAQNQQNILQSAGYGIGALGPAAQNSVLSGANAQLGTGGLQQQLAQAQLNAPYQQQLAQSAFPYQQAQFLAGITGALAPGLGGTTYGTGSQTSPGPSVWSQLLGAGTAAAGIYGQSGGFGGKGSTGGAPGTSIGGTYGPTSYGGANGPTPLAGYARGGATSPYGIDLPRRGDGSYGFDDGGAVESSPYKLPEMFNSDPINVDQKSIIPTGQIPAIHAQQPTLNLNPQKPAQQSGGDAGQMISSAIKMAGMFMKRGGAVNPYGFAEGGDTDVINPDEPFRMPGEAAMDDWRSGADSAMALAAPDGPASPAARAVAAAAGPGRRMTASAVPPNPYAAAARPADPEDPNPPSDSADFAKSPWAAVTAAGLGMLAGSSPFAGVNIGQGGMQGLKTLEAQRAAGQKDTTIAQSAARLAQEARFHEDQYSKMTPYQQATVDLNTKTREDQYTRMTPAQKQAADIHERDISLKEMQPVKVGSDPIRGDIYARKDPRTGDYIDTMTGKKVEVPSAFQAAPKWNVPGDQSSADDAAIPAHARFVEGVSVPQGVDTSVLAQLPPQIASKVRAVDEGRISLTTIPLKERGQFMNWLTSYDPSFDQSTWTARNAQQRDMSTNGNAGKMILAVNQLLPHLKTASDKANELANTDYPAANTVANFWATQTGDPRVKKFDTVREVAAMDAARLLRGSGAMAEGDIEFWRKTLNSAGSPAQLQETLGLLADDLMGARISSIQHSYRMNMRMDPPELVDNHAKEALETIRSRQPGGKTAAPSPAGTPPAAGGAPAGGPPAAAKPDAGTRYQQLTADGMSKADAYAKMKQEGY